MRGCFSIALISLTLVVACSESARVERGGFLGDYSDLQPGRGDQAQRVFIDTAADFSRYEKVLIDPVVTWDTSAGSGDPDPALQRIADQFDAALRSELQREFELAMDSGTDTLRIRAAITGVHKSGVSVELEVLDAASGRRLAAVADTRGAPSDGVHAADATSVEEALAFWAHRTRVRLAAFRSFDSAEASREADNAGESN